MVWLKVMAIRSSEPPSVWRPQRCRMEGMAIAPVLAGPWVRLRMPRVEDAEAMFTDPTSDPEVARYLSWTPHPNVAETRRVITDVFNVGPGPTWLIERRDTGEFVGTCGPRPNAVE